MTRPRSGPLASTVMIGLLLLAASCASPRRPPSPETGRTVRNREPAATAAIGPPNILFILMDDAHFQSFKVSGHHRLLTPHTDDLAGRGLVFRQATVATPLCAPSRATFLTGLFAHTHGISHNPPWHAPKVKPDRRSTVPQALAAAGYRTILVGKTHIGDSPESMGFQTSLCRPNPANARRCGEDNLLPESPATDTVDVMVEKVEVLLNRTGPEPFFLWLSLVAPHSPIYAQPPYLDLYRALDKFELVPPGHAPLEPYGQQRAERWRRYAAKMSQVDSGIGRIVQTLRRNRQLTNTAIFIAGDNGWLGGAHGSMGKKVAWEDSIRIPLVAAIPGPEPPSGFSDAPVSSIDLAPTWLDLAGLPRPAQMPGRSLLPLFRQPDGQWRESAYVEYLEGDPAVEPYRLVRTPAHKLVVRQEGTRMLFDLSRDPFERQDLSEQPASAGVMKGLLAEMRTWMERTGDPARSWLQNGDEIGQNALD